MPGWAAGASTMSDGEDVESKVDVWFWVTSFGVA